MTTRAATDRASSPAPGGVVAWVGIAVAIAFLLGVLTAYAQDWLPASVGSIANSSGSWSLVAFALAMFAVDRRTAALVGFLALLMLLAGYVVALGWRGYAAGTALVTFWGLAAVVAGPLLGLGSFWLRTGTGYLAALGSGAMAGVLIGEGAYGLIHVAETTYPPYWWVEIAVGGALAGWAVGWRLRRWRVRLVAIGLALVVAAAFDVVYSLDLIAVIG